MEHGGKLDKVNDHPENKLHDVEYQQGQPHLLMRIDEVAKLERFSRSMSLRPSYVDDGARNHELNEPVGGEPPGETLSTLKLGAIRDFVTHLLLKVRAYLAPRTPRGSNIRKPVVIKMAWVLACFSRSERGKDMRELLERPKTRWGLKGLHYMMHSRSLVITHSSEKATRWMA